MVSRLACGKSTTSNSTRMIQLLFAANCGTMTFWFWNIDQQSFGHYNKVLQAVDLLEVYFIKIKTKCCDLPPAISVDPRDSLRDEVANRQKTMRVRAISWRQKCFCSNNN